MTAANNLLGILDPKTLMNLYRAGAIDRRTPFALAASLPWLIGRGPSLGVLSRINATALGTKTALIDEQGALSFAELDRRAERAACLLARLGAGPEDGVAFLLRNGRVFLELLLGAQKAGVTAYPLNTWARPVGLRHCLETSRPRVLVYDTAHSDQLPQRTGHTVLVATDPTEKTAPGSLLYEELLQDASPSPQPAHARHPGSPRIVIQTSGTTGKPKGASRKATSAGLRMLTSILSVVPYRRQDVIYCPAPAFHAFGLATHVFATALGATLILPRKFDPREALATMESHRVTAASFVPVMIRRMLSLPENIRELHDLSTLRIVLVSGASMPQGLRREAMRLFGDVLYDLYGSTETGWVAIATPGDMKKRPGTVGRPAPGTEVAVFSAEGDPVTPGQVGELHVRSGMLFEGYTSDDRKPLRDGYLAVGDLGWMSADDYLFIQGRADDMVIVGGENVYPIQIEEVIETMSEVSEACVAGVQDEEYGEVLVAFVEGETSEEEVLAVCRKELPSFKVPKRVHVVRELPRTGSGKVRRRELVERLESRQ